MEVLFPCIYLPFHLVRVKKESLYICVCDTGPGIPEEDLNRIFNRFYQSQNQVKYPVYGQAGTGIGFTSANESFKCTVGKSRYATTAFQAVRSVFSSPCNGKRKG